MWLLLWAVVDRAGEPGRAADDRRADQSALERIAAGDHDALAELYDRHARPIYSLALRILQNQADAEDIVQEVVSQAWRQASRYDATRGNVAAWLLTLARSRAIDRLRARRARPDRGAGELALTDVADQTAAVDLQLLSAEQVARVRAALDALPLLQRMAIELAYYEGLTHAEIAERLEQPLGTVKTRIRLAMMKLREALAGA
jgi:RNA polymerase sigma-70 factor (ECF subfamily)